MPNRTRLLIFIAAATICLVTVFVIFKKQTSPSRIVTNSNLTEDKAPQADSAPISNGETEQEEPGAIPRLINAVRDAVTPDPETPKTSGRLVPFTSQAPFGDWDDPRQQDGCEEASLIMAWHWLEGTPLEKSQALQEILTLSRWSEEHIGEYLSTSAEDTARLFREFYHYDIAVSYDITTDDISREVDAGNLVLVPTDGTKLGNPYFVQPGPSEHMIVITSYDSDNKEFITNDPGTRHGEGYRYSTVTLNNALRDYPTGYHEPNPNPRTAMLVIKPKP